MAKLPREMLARFAWLPRSDIPGIVFGALLLIAVLAAMIWVPSHVTPVNNGLGPEWDCQTIGGASATTCIKRLPPK